MRRSLLVLAFLLLGAVPAIAQVVVVVPGRPQAGQASISVSSSTVGITANLCGAGNAGGALIQVQSNSMYLALHSATATASSTDFAVAVGSIWYVKPASLVRVIRQSADGLLKVQCIQ